MTIPLMDITANYPQIKDEVVSKFNELIASSSFIGGEEVTQFESEFACFSGTKHCIGCSNGTDALVIALKALDVGVDDTVLVPANSFIATAEAVTAVGAKLDFADIEKDYYAINPDYVESYIKKNKKHVKAVIPVHLYGQMADMSSLRYLANKHGFYIIEDAAQAQGALYEGDGPGNWGDIASYSFYPGKNLGAFGDAGGLTTNDSELAKRCKMLSNHGRLPGEKYFHHVPGYNHRLDTMQAAVLRIKLKHLSQWNKMRQRIADQYSDKLKDVVVTPKVRKGSLHVWYVYTILVNNREKFIENTKEYFKCGIYYPLPLHKLNAYSDYENCKYEVTEKITKHIVSIPMYPELSDNAVGKVIEVIRSIEK